MGLIDCHAKEAIPIFIDLIHEVQGQQTAHMQRLLRHIAGTGPAQQQSDEKESQAEAQKAWREWWNANVANVTSEQVTHGYTLLFSHTHVGEMDLPGKFVWRTEFHGTLEMEGKLYTEPTAASMLPHGNILLGESWRQWRPGTGA